MWQIKYINRDGEYFASPSCTVSEFIVWWNDSDSMKFIVEHYSRVSEAFARVSELRNMDIEVLPVKRVLKGV